MERTLKAFIEKESEKISVIGILLVERNRCRNNHEMITIVVIETETPVLEPFIHFYSGTKIIDVHVIAINDISRNLINGSNPMLTDWVLSGKILFERDYAVSNIKESIKLFPTNNRKYKMTVEFSSLIRRYAEGKNLFDAKQYLDAFQSILQSLHHLARLSVIEHGIYPELTVWEQVKKIEPEIYTLYKEMVTGDESLEKRLELLLIASQFSLTLKTKTGSAHLLDLMKSSEKKAWSIQQLMLIEESREYHANLPFLLDYLVQKGIIDIVKIETNNELICERHYCVR